jgi:hypothetical protein
MGEGQPPLPELQNKCTTVKSFSLSTSLQMVLSKHKFYGILYFNVNYSILIGWENLDKMYCWPLIDEYKPKSVQKHNNGPHFMTTMNIKKISTVLILCAYSLP